MTAATSCRAVDAFAARARAAGHPVLFAAPGRWTSSGGDGAAHPTGGGSGAAPNDVLDAARETAYARLAWVYAVLPSGRDAVRLAAAVAPPGPAPAVAPTRPVAAAGAAWRRLLRTPTPTRGGDPRHEPFDVLVARTRPTVRTLTVLRGHVVHLAEIPAAWIDRPLTEVPR